ncbi:MurR/RpiR family transcriptional regulator [Corynebacterium sp. BF-R-2]|uniref:MurR/RpiR family transcriptional regulator n=1 Tax=Corynebacterium sp. BF-R-2 TaxID=2943494 RepID=UPI00211E809D|nr:MurR/RpiR family transcriptional regulator [Corynebacterium sp. BF-R-2]MCQ9675754.1 MurR/RpiR family transcriptional regulator [Corynebacterium sp. BF-R-2]
MTDTAPPSAHITTRMPSLQPIEQRVARAILEDMDFVLHATADQLAAKVGTSRTSVIRTAQALGYDGYQQLRVALTQEIAQRPRQLPGVDSTYVGRMSAEIASFSNYLHGLTTLLNEKELTATVESLVGAKRVLIVGNGLSAPLAQTMALRLTSIGRPAEFVGEATGQHIAATQLDSECVCLVVSGSGSTTLTLKAATAAHASGAAIIALTSFTSSPLADLATYTLVIPSPDGTFRAELADASRVAFLLVLEALVTLVDSHLDDSAARRAVLTVLQSAMEN